MIPKTKVVSLLPHAFQVGNCSLSSVRSCPVLATCGTSGTNRLDATPCYPSVLLHTQISSLIPLLPRGELQLHLDSLLPPHGQVEYYSPRSADSLTYLGWQPNYLILCTPQDLLGMAVSRLDPRVPRLTFSGQESQSELELPLGIAQ